MIEEQKQKQQQKKGVPVWVFGVLGAGVSGVLMAVCFWPFGWHFFAWVGLVPVLLVLPRVKPDQAMLMGVIFSFVFYRISLDWLFGLAGPIGVVAVVIFSILVSFGFYVARLMIGRFGEWALLWGPAVCLMAVELMRCEGLPTLRFSYAGWGYSQARNLWLAQIASIGGVYFITFLMVAFNSALAYGINGRKLKYWMPAVILAGVIVGLGFVSQPGSYEGREMVSVGCVQEESYDYMEYVALVEECFADESGPKFIVLPEHALSTIVDERHKSVEMFGELALEHQGYICVGAYVEASPGAEMNMDNVAMLIGPEGTIESLQVKSVTIPFFSDDGNPATEQFVVETRFGTVGSYVCYDGGFTDVVRRLTAMGAELILGPVMNPVEWPEAQRYQQADVAVFRSIENRRCVVRAASSGISQVIDATGRVTAERLQDEGAGILVGSVYFNDEKSVFVRGGYVFQHVVGWVFLVLGPILIVQDRYLYWVNRRRGKKEKA
ncbi:MAG: hypothetical protein GY869_08830 [Planctomycetes bacterium]|nr:hypothetical protein [Planctomycetota bacterium]